MLIAETSERKIFEMYNLIKSNNYRGIYEELFDVFHFFIAVLL